MNMDQAWSETQLSQVDLWGGVTYFIFIRHNLKRYCSGLKNVQRKIQAVWAPNGQENTTTCKYTSVQDFDSSENTNNNVASVVYIFIASQLSLFT